MITEQHIADMLQRIADEQPYTYEERINTLLHQMVTNAMIEMIQHRGQEGPTLAAFITVVKTAYQVGIYVGKGRLK